MDCVLMWPRFVCFLCLFSCFFLIPFKSKFYFYFFIVLDVILLMLYGLFLAGDVVFFKIFSKHITVELPTAIGNIQFLIAFSFYNYWYVVLFLFFVLVAVLKFGFGLIKKFYSQNLCGSTIKEALILILMLSIISFIGIWGRFSIRGKPLRNMDADIFGERKIADISLNGIFTSYQAMRNFKNKKMFLDEKGAYEASQKYIVTKSETVYDLTYPLMRKRNKSNWNKRQPNIVILLLESWNKKFALAHSSYVPNFTELWEQGRRYPNFYASGIRSLMGLTGTLFSIPYLYHLPTINKGLEMNNFPRFAKYFKNLGYKTYFIQSDKRKAENAEKIARYMDFDVFFGAEDNPFIREYLPKYKKNDYEAYQLLLHELDLAPEKFMAFFYTATPHYPYDEELPEKFRVTPGSNEDERYLNLIHYSDAGLGYFMKHARKRRWFNNTIFFILPDHRPILNNKNWGEEDPVDNIFLTFLIIYAPNFFKPETRDEYACQEDLFPTLLDIIGSEEYYASTGQSLLDPDRKKEVILFGEDGFTYIVGEGLRIKTDLNRIKIVPHTETLEFKALAIEEMLMRTLKNDRWMKTW